MLPLTATELNGQYKVKGLSIKTIQDTIIDSQLAKSNSRPISVIMDHTKEQNPYISLYDEEWRQKLSITSHMSKYIRVFIITQRKYSKELSTTIIGISSVMY